MKLAATILAAGKSVRMGNKNKLLLLIKKKPLIEIVCENVMKARLDQIILVTGYQAKKILKVIPKQINEVVHNHNWDKGMMTSIITGISNLKNNIDGNIIILGDMPLISTNTIVKLKDEFKDSGGKSIVFPIYQNKQGNPVVFPKTYFTEILKYQGDNGCKNILNKYKNNSLGIRLESEEVLVDCDTEDDYLNLKNKNLNNVEI